MNIGVQTFAIYNQSKQSLHTTCSHVSIPQLADLLHIEKCNS